MNEKVPLFVPVLVNIKLVDLEEIGQAAITPLGSDFIQKGALPRQLGLTEAYSTAISLALLRPYSSYVVIRVCRCIPNGKPRFRVRARVRIGEG